MKRPNGKTLGFLIVAAILALAALTASCAKSAEAVDVVNGVRPASTALNIHGYAEELARLPEAERAAYLKRERPQLEQGVVYYLRHEVNRIRHDQEVERVEFFFGSLDRVKADDGNGVTHEGYFKDQLVARVRVKGAEPVDVLVKCLNRWFVLPGQLDELQSLGAGVPQERFTIGPREGLTRHVDYPVAIDLAERFDLPLYRGRTQEARFLINPDEARRLESETDRIQVTVYVVEGDAFDLVARTFTRRGVVKQ